jgi:hypothetical protein
MLRPSPLPPGFIPPCLPTASDRCKSGPDWVHEIKHDGYRLIARRNGDRVRLYTRRGYNWADRYPRILEALEDNQFGLRSVAIHERQLLSVEKSLGALSSERIVEENNDCREHRLQRIPP